jgi:hypothetical protein
MARERGIELFTARREFNERSGIVLLDEFLRNGRTNHYDVT